MQRKPSHRQLQVVAAEHSCQVKAAVAIVCLTMHPAPQRKTQMKFILWLTPDRAITAEIV